MSAALLDGAGGVAYGAAVNAETTRTLDGSAAAAFDRARRRRPPSASEQARREAWGREWGPKVGSMIRQSIARSEG
jgi:hypothetical protein